MQCRLFVAFRYELAVCFASCNLCMMTDVGLGHSDTGVSGSQLLGTIQVSVGNCITRLLPSPMQCLITGVQVYPVYLYHMA
jgi:hypothetical protein